MEFSVLTAVKIIPFARYEKGIVIRYDIGAPDPASSTWTDEKTGLKIMARNPSMIPG